MKTRLTQASAIARQTCHRLLQASLVGCVVGLGTTQLVVAQTPEAGEGAASQTPESPASMMASPSGRSSLRPGSQGEAVKTLQALLKLLGYYSGDVSGLYQEDTAAAVSAFQRDAGLTADGVVGPDTWNRLLPTVPIAQPQASRTPTAAAPVPQVNNFPATPAPQGQNTEAAEPAATDSTSTNTAATSQPAPVESSTPEASPSPDGDAETPAAEQSSSDASAAAATSETEETETAAPTSSTTTRASTVTETAAAPTPVALPVLRAGMYGPAVVQLQERLQALGFYTGALDGVFGPETQNAVQEAQRRYQLTADGVVGPATWGALLRSNRP